MTSFPLGWIEIPKCADAVGDRLHEEGKAADLRPRQRRLRVAQLGIEVLRERLADTAHEVAHQAAAADLGERAGQRIADDDIDAGGVPAGLLGDRGQAVVDAARSARAAPAVAAAALHDLAEFGRNLPDRALAGEAGGDGADLRFEAAGDPVALRRTGERQAGHGASYGLHVGHEAPDRLAGVGEDEALGKPGCAAYLLGLADADADGRGGRSRVSRRR